MQRGYFEIGIYNGKTEYNLGTLWRSAYQLGAAGIFTIGTRYKKQSSDTTKTWRHIPFRQYENFKHFLSCRPYDCTLVGIETGRRELSFFSHPHHAVYLLGAEDGGLPKEMIKECNALISVQFIRKESYNVAVAGSIVMYHRMFGATLE